MRSSEWSSDVWSADLKWFGTHLHALAVVRSALRLLHVDNPHVCIIRVLHNVFRTLDAPTSDKHLQRLNLPWVLEILTREVEPRHIMPQALTDPSGLATDHALEHDQLSLVLHSSAQRFLIHFDQR